MGRAKSQKEPDAQAAKRSGYEKYEVITIHRSQAKNAPYNPRMISAEAKRRLKKNIRDVGLLAPIVWNRRTGHIVAGHQRLAVLDSLEGTQDYEITVACVDLEEAEEKEQNVFMNNPDAQGVFDIEKLEPLLRNGGLSVENMGFDAADVMKICGAESLTAEAVAEISDRLRQMHDRIQHISSQSAARDDQDFYIVAVFASHEDRLSFTAALGVEDNRYIDGRLLRRAIARQAADPTTPSS